jgi:hypothetical protein
MGHRQLSHNRARFIQKDNIMLFFTPVNPDIGSHLTLLSRMTGVFFPDQIDCVPVMALAGRHVFDSTLVDLGDCPYKALAARILRGPQIQARLRMGFQLAIGLPPAVIPIRIAFVHYTVTGFFAIAQNDIFPLLCFSRSQTLFGNERNERKFQRNSKTARQK